LTTNAACSPAIGINNGQVTLNCADPEIAARVRSLPDLSDYNSNMLQLEDLRGQAEQIEKKLYQLEIDSNAKSKDIARLQEQLTLAESKFSTLYQQHVQLSTELAAELSRIPEIVEAQIDATEVRINSAIAESVIDQQIQKYTNNIFFKLDNKLNDQRSRIDNLEKRVVALENDVSFLMGEYLEGRLQKNVGFFGLSVGGLYISKEWQSRIGLEYELLMPKAPIIGSRGSVYFEFAKLDWTESTKYQTLPGVDPIEVVDNHNLNILNLGSRIFFHEWSKDLHSYFGVSFGHSISSDEDTFNTGVGIGTELFRSGTRIALEARWEWFSNIEREEISFNPIGDALITTISESRDGWYLGLKIAFH